MRSTKGSEQFDGVILATPMELTSIQLPVKAQHSTGRGRKHPGSRVGGFHSRAAHEEY